MGATWQNDGMRGALDRRLLYVVPWLLLVTQCAARAPVLTPAQLADAGRAEALMRDGCYACLREANTIYTRLLEPAARKTPERALRGAFGTAVLLAVRERELGLPADASLARARELGSRLSVSGASGNAATGVAPQVAPAVLLEAAEAVSGDVTMLDAEERQQKEERKSASIPSLPSTSDLTTTYLAMAIQCEQPRGSKGDATSPPLLRYRAAICSSGSQESVQTLTKIREADPRWT
jgi:hypothetical protein